MNILRTALAVGVTFIACWIWNSVYFCVTSAGIPNNYFIAQPGVILLMVSCCVNPIIYTVNLTEFQQGARQLIAIVLRKVPPSLSNLFATSGDAAGNADSPASDLKTRGCVPNSQPPKDDTTRTQDM